MEVLIEKIDHMGKGICFVNGKITFVPFTIPGDKVDIILTKETKNYNEGKVNNFIKYSDNRVNSKCPYFGKCGGCQLHHMSYEDTVCYKTDRVKNILRNIYNGDINFIKNDNSYNYRNKIELKIVNGKIGFYENNSHNLFEIKECLITKQSINNFISYIPNFNIVNGDITVRCNYNDELLISINTLDKVNIEKDYSRFKVVGIVVNNVTLYGENKFLDKIKNLFFEVSYDSFFQVNSNINEKLFNIIGDNVTGESVLDLYSGVGTLSLMASLNAKKVYGIEVVKNAVLNAIKNSKINNINNINFILGKVEDKIEFIKDDIDTIIVDPPRSGLDDKTINIIKKMNPKKIIYISCETQKLASDLTKLVDIYNISNVYALDMFSYTYHCETICVLERK